MTASPILPAYRHADNIHLLVFFPGCHLWHWHSSGEKPGDGDGHRAAHCGDNLPREHPLRNSGYILKEVGPFTKAVRDAQQVNLALPRRNFSRHALYPRLR